MRFVGLVLLGLVIWIVVQSAANMPSLTLPEPATTASIPKPDPHRAALEKFKIASFQWGKQYNIMTAHFTFQNDNEFAVKDPEVRCEHDGPSGTRIDSNTRTIYEVFKPKSKRTIRDFNMGFIHSQAAKSGCIVRRLVALSP